MQYKQLRLWIPFKDMIIPVGGITTPEGEKKHICFGFYPENTDFLSTYNFLNIRVNFVRHVFVPTMQKPLRSYLTPQYRKELRDRKLRAYKGKPEEIMKVIPNERNFYIDPGDFLSKSIDRWKIRTFQTGRAIVLTNKVLDILNIVPSQSYEKTLIYAVDLNKPIAENLKRRRIYPIYKMIRDWTKDPENNTLPFDRLLMFTYNGENSQYYLLFDINKRVNHARIKSFMKNLKPTLDMDEVEDDIVEKVVKDKIDLVSKDETEIKAGEKIPKRTQQSSIPKFVSTKERKIIGNSIDNYLDVEPTLKNQSSDDILRRNSKVSLLIKSLAYQAIGDIKKSELMSNKIKNLPKSSQQKVIQKYVDIVTPKEKVESSSDVSIIKDIKPEELTDYQNPKHIIEKRKINFEENLQKDIMDGFKVLSTKDIPLKVKKVSKKVESTSPSVINKTISEIYTVELEDDKGKKQEVNLKIPKLSESGTFLINGREQILVNQIITYPIFFFKPYHAMFSSSYSSFSIISKKTKSLSYLQVIFAGYKIPLILLLGYKMGFEKCLDLFGVKYSILKEQEGVETDFAFNISFPNKMKVRFVANDEVGYEFIQSIKKLIKSFPSVKFDLNSNKVWMDLLTDIIGNKNCVYQIDEVWANIVTPIEKELLLSRGDPISIEKIVKYMADGSVSGRVDDRNGIDKLRVRSSEVITSLLQNQIHLAYNEYRTKKLSGDKNAEMYINPTHVFSQILKSQNLQPLENINPLEELSSMTRISPVGIGGVPDVISIPVKSLNIHPTYFGNIDPLETPNGLGIGVQQHLTVGASIGTSRGTFNIKNTKDVKPSEILSAGSAMIPFVESNDGCRVNMAVGQSKQALPLTDPEPPAIQSGYESILTSLLSDNFVKKSPVSGKISEINDKYIVIKDKSGKKHNIDISYRQLKSGQGVDSISEFKVKKEVGNSVKENEIIAEGSSITDGLICNGKNILVAFMPWKGYNFEDGMVISESAAKYFKSIHLKKQEIIIEEDDDIVRIANVGDQIDKGLILVSYGLLDDVDSHKHLRSIGGKILNIEIYSNVAPDKIPKNLKPLYNEFREKYKSQYGKYPTGSFKEKERANPFKGIKLIFSIKQELTLEKGDKLNNRHFNKGVVSIIEKDENMPMTPWGERVQMLYNPLSVINRMNTGQLLEMHTGLISKTLLNLMVKENRSSFTKILQVVMDLLDGTENKKYSKRLLSTIKEMSDNQYKKFVDKIQSYKFFPIVVPPFKSPQRDNILQALKLLKLKPRYPLEIPEYNKTSDPVSVGYIYVQKLEHMSEKKIHARGLGSYVSKTMAPTAGKARGGGAKIGEHDLYSLLAWDCPHVIDEFFGPLSTDHTTKNRMVSDVVQNGNTGLKTAKSNPVKEQFSQLMTALHLEAT